VRVGAVSSPSFKLAELARRPQLTVTFADGELVRVVRVTKPYRFGRAFLVLRLFIGANTHCARFAAPSQMAIEFSFLSDLFGLSSKAELSIFDFDGDMLLHPVLFDTCADR
jgi:hypothetical protein